MIEKKIIIIVSIIATVVTVAICYFFCLPKNDSKQVFLASIYNNIESYNDVFLNLQKPEKNSNAIVGVISHHFLAKQLIADFYNKTGSEKIKTIYLISPDHFQNFYPSSTIAYTSYAIWQTPFGNIDADKKNIDAISKDNKIKTNNSALGLEHGIYIEVPFIKNFFPNAKIVPLVLNMGIGTKDFFELGSQIRELSNENSLLIISSDFSHDLSVENALEKDSKSIETLKSLNRENLQDITNDCKQCLAVLSGFLDNNENYKFNLVDNKNSFDISKENKNSVTSYISGYWAPKEDIQILFVGDLMFDRGIRYYAQKNGSNEFIFDKISSELLSNDLVVANLEGPITKNISVSSGTVPGSTNNYIFTFDPNVAETLYKENIKLVNLGNNHILNFGDMSPVSTEKYLAQENVNYFGAPRSNKSIIKEIENIKIAFINYNEFYADTEEQILQEIVKTKQEADILIIFCHWGVEYSKDYTQNQQDLAHNFIDAGADLIIGSHSHVIGPMEEYKNKRIYYSLGNFIFDQYFDEDVRNGLGVKLKINLKTKQLDFEEIKFYLDSEGQTKTLRY